MKKLISTALVSIIIFNQVMAMDILNKKEENIVRVAAFAAAGDQQKLKAALADGLDSGVSVRKYSCRPTPTAASRAASTRSARL